MIRAIVTDIEGTTSSLSFVKDVLFPYARQHIGEYVRSHAGEKEIAILIDDVRKQAGELLDLEGVIAQLERWIDEDQKVTALKTLQGMLWEAGYKQGDFKGHIYADAHEQLTAWQKQGIQLYVYSSGSVYAQKLLFGHTDYGNLNHLFSGYFDTHVGAKTEAVSYQRIAEQLGLSTGEILFLSDIKAELDAASEAGMQAVWLVRDNEPDPTAPYRQASNFHELQLS